MENYNNVTITSSHYFLNIKIITLHKMALLQSVRVDQETIMVLLEVSLIKY